MIHWVYQLSIQLALALLEVMTYGFKKTDLGTIYGNTVSITGLLT